MQLGTGKSDAQLGRLGASRRHGDPALRAATSRCSTECRTSAARAVTIPLSGFQTPLSGPVSRRSGSSPTRGIWAHRRLAQLQGPSGHSPHCRSVNPGPPDTSLSNRTSSTRRSRSRRVGHLAHAELQEQPRLRRRPVRTERVFGKEPRAALDQRRRLPAGRGDDRHRPVRARITATKSVDAPRRVRRHAVVLGRGPEHRPGRRNRARVQRPRSRPVRVRSAASA